MSLLKSHQGAYMHSLPKSVLCTVLKIVSKTYQIHYRTISMTACWLFYYVILEGNDQSSFVLYPRAWICICSWWTLWMFACLWMSVEEAQLRFSLPEMCSWERRSSIRTHCGPYPIKKCSMALTVCGHSLKTLQVEPNRWSCVLVCVLWKAFSVTSDNMLMVAIKKCSTQLFKALLWLTFWEEVN